MTGFGRVSTAGFRRWLVLGALGVLLVFVALSLSSCMGPAREKARHAQSQSAMKAEAPGMGGQPMPPGSAMGPGMAPMPGAPGMPGPGGPSGGFAAQRERSSSETPVAEGESSFAPVGSAEFSLLIIKTADLTIEVKSIEMAGNQVTEISRSAGGFVSSSSFSRTEDDDTPYGNVTIRVPVSAFENVLTRIGRVGEVTAKNVSGEDVTGQVFDLEARLRNKRAEEAQYVEIMQKAKRIPDIITVSNQLFRVRGEIEQIQGRVKFLRSASDMSTITLTLTEGKTVSSAGIPGVFQSALNALKGASLAVLYVVIWLGVFSPYWIALGVLIYLLVRLRRGRRA